MVVLKKIQSASKQDYMDDTRRYDPNGEDMSDDIQFTRNSMMIA